MLFFVDKLLKIQIKLYNNKRDICKYKMEVIIMKNKIEELQKLINESDNIVFFGGAGVSTASGLKDFRSKNGLYSNKNNVLNVTPEFMLSSSCFYSFTKEFYRYYKENMNALNVKPNIIHKYLTKLEKDKKLKAIITQNIDGLHQKAGSKNVLELHGTIYKNYCIKCHKEYTAEFVFHNEGIPRCECGGLIKPAVVLYGEMLPDDFIKAKEYISKCDLLIVAGTSLTVEPAASLVSHFKGRNLVIINNDKTQYDGLATLVINDNLAKVFKELK